MTVLSLLPATRSVVGTLKTTLSEAAATLGASTITVALRDNGPKINGTLVMLEGTVGQAGDVLNARSARNKIVYGPHLILAVVTLNADGTVASVAGDIDVDGDLKAALFQVDASPAAEAKAAVAAAVADVVSVKRAKDGEVVAADVSLAEANELIAKAKAADNELEFGK